MVMQIHKQLIPIIILGSFAEFRKATPTFVMSLSARLQSVHMEQPGFHWTDIHKILLLRGFFFEKSVEKINFIEI
jgi:hypothetical protein